MNKEQKEILAEYIEYLKVRKRNYLGRKSSIKIYFNYLESSGIDFLMVRIPEAQEFQHYLTTLTDDKGKPYYSSVTVVTIVGRVTTFYNYLKRKKYIFSNPFLEIERIKRSKSLPADILNEKEMNKFLKGLRNFMRGKDLIERRQIYKAHVIAEVMYSTGARINEVTTMKITDIDFIRGTIKLRDSKTGKEREGILNNYTEKVLRLYIDEMREHILLRNNNMDLLFGSSGSIKIWINKILARECERMKLGKITSHHFRHAIGYHLLKGGCDIRYIQEILGHKELSTTQIYTKVVKEDLRGVLDTYHPRVFKRKK